MTGNPIRPRRLRQNPLLRNLTSETQLRLANLVQPYFLTTEPNGKEAIQGFTGVYRWGVDLLSKKIETDLDRGLNSFLLFGAASGDEKNERGSAAYEEKGLLPTAIRTLKSRFSENILLFSDVCLCPYTSHGHCGLIEKNEIVNDLSLQPLAEMALVHARSGVDFVAPSDMMDFRVGFIRQALDAQGFTNTGIMAYTAKYASNYYGPFREALGSAPKGTDRASYQMDFRNKAEALRELELDVQEGADMVMVKPALAYLDIIQKFKENAKVPVAAYSVSAEYQLVKLLAKEGLADERKLAMENLTSIRRAGADIIMTYFAEHIAEGGWL